MSSSCSAVVFHCPHGCGCISFFRLSVCPIICVFAEFQVAELDANFLEGADAADVEDAEIGGLEPFLAEVPGGLLEGGEIGSGVGLVAACEVD